MDITTILDEVKKGLTYLCVKSYVFCDDKSVITISLLEKLDKKTINAKLKLLECVYVIQKATYSEVDNMIILETI